MNQNYRNYSAWDSHSQAGKHVNNHTSASHNMLNLSLKRKSFWCHGSADGSHHNSWEYPDPDFPGQMCPSAQNPPLPLENIACPEFQRDPCETLFTTTCRDAAQFSQNSGSCPVVPNKITSSSENTAISSVHNCCQNPRSPARKINSWNTV